MLEGVVNFRDVGGHRTADGATVRTGWIYRAAHFAGATDADIAELERREVKLFIDFRGPDDIAADGANRMPQGARLVSIPMFDPAGANDIRGMMARGDAAELEAAWGGGRAHQVMERGAVELVTRADRLAGYGRMLRELVDADSPSVIHCSAGKDRTGWGASLVLLALGVPETTVVEHYLESNNHRRTLDRRAVRSEVDLELLRPFFEVRAQYARASIAAMHEQWGDVARYVRDGLGIPDADFARFRDHMLA